MPLDPYYSGLINEIIETQAEHDLVARVLTMDVNQLLDFRDDINAEAAIDPAYVHSRECILGCKAVIRRAQQLRKSGAGRPTLSWPEAIALTMGGMILGDEFSKRFLRGNR